MLTDIMGHDDNITDPDPEQQPSLVVVMISLSIVSAVVVVLNLGVMIVLIIDKNLRTDLHCVALLSLSVSDFLLGITCLCIAVQYCFTDVMTFATCFSFYYLFMVAWSASNMHIVFICIERIVGVKKPMQFKNWFTAGRNTLYIAFLWLFSAVVIGIPSIFWMGESVEVGVHFHCDIKTAYKGADEISAMASLYYLLLYIAMILLFVRLLFLLAEKRRKKIKAMNSSLRRSGGRDKDNGRASLRDLFDDAQLEVLTCDGTQPLKSILQGAKKACCVAPNTSQQSDFTTSKDGANSCDVNATGPCKADEIELGKIGEKDAVSSESKSNTEVRVKRSSPNGRASVVTQTSCSHGKKHSTTNFDRRRDPEIEAARGLGVIILVVTFLLVPSWSSILIDSFVTSFEMSRHMRGIFLGLGVINSIFNPLIYVFTLSKFRSSIRMACIRK